MAGQPTSQPQPPSPSLLGTVPPDIFYAPAGQVSDTKLESVKAKQKPKRTRRKGAVTENTPDGTPSQGKRGGTRRGAEGNGFSGKGLTELACIAVDINLFGATRKEKSAKWELLVAKAASCGLHHSVDVYRKKLKQIMLWHEHPQKATKVIQKALEGSNGIVISALLTRLCAERDTYKEKTDVEWKKLVKKAEEDAKGGELICSLSMKGQCRQPLSLLSTNKEDEPSPPSHGGSEITDSEDCAADTDPFFDDDDDDAEPDEPSTQDPLTNNIIPQADKSAFKAKKMVVQGSDTASSVIRDKRKVTNVIDSEDEDASSSGPPSVSQCTSKRLRCEADSFESLKHQLDSESAKTRLFEAELL